MFMHASIYFIVPIFSITPSGNNIAGEQYQLTCTFASSIDNTPMFAWVCPPSDRTLPSDTRIVSNVMSSEILSGFAYTSILRFNPLNSSHEGNYTCQVMVGNETEMRSIQVNVTSKS